MTICWFGIYNPDFGRNKIYIKALKKAGHKIIECRDSSAGLVKYWRLWRKHNAIKNSYDVLIVGYPGHIVVPLAKFLSKKLICVDALGSLYDAEVNSHRPSFSRKIKSKIADFLMVKYADKIFLESEEQKKFFEEKYGKSEKYEVLYTGADEDLFISIPFGESDRQNIFTVLFRGKLTPESGVMYILEAINILKNNNSIYFKIIGAGYFQEKVRKFIEEKELKNVDFITKFLQDDDLRREISDADLALGQFENNPRLDRTIPHKAFEAFAMGIPYLTLSAPAIKEIAKNDDTAFFIFSSIGQELAEKIESLSKNPIILDKVSRNALVMFKNEFSFTHISDRIQKAVMLK
ncbi:MAG: glycosyltransferase [Parcubacteria group bacterium]|nr:glycosyltransferase [Parcubacteria group bacterium]